MPYTVDLTITNPDGQSVTLSQSFSFSEAPRILGAPSPASGPESGGTSVSVPVQFVQPGAVVTIGGRPVLGLSVSASSVSFVTPDMR